MKAHVRIDGDSIHVRSADQRGYRRHICASFTGVLTVAAVAVALFAGCGDGTSADGGSPNAAASAAASPSASASPVTVAPEPAATYARGEIVPKGAVRVIERYFAAVTAGDADAAQALLTPDSMMRTGRLRRTVVTHVRVAERLPYAAPRGFSAEAAVTAYVDAAEPNSWGPPGEKSFFVILREAPAGVWLISEIATGR